MIDLLNAMQASGELAAFVNVVLIDVALAADNAIIVGSLATGLDPKDRRKVLLIGIITAFVLRIGLSLIATQLLQFIGLLLAGGLLLLWVAWKMYRDLKHEATTSVDDPTTSPDETAVPKKTFWSAVLAVTMADASMSLDNVLAVAGAARDHKTAMIFGLALAVVLMAVAANVMSRLITRYKWIAWLGLATITYVACKMIWDGGHQVVAHLPV